MVAFSTAFLAACLVLAAAGGIRMIRDDGTKHLTCTGSTVGTAIDIEEPRQEGVFVKLIDTLGMRGQQALRRLYGPVRLRALDQRLRSAGNPEGLHLDLFIQREAGFVILSAILLLIFALLGRWTIGIVVAVVFSGWMYLWLAQALRNRQKKLNRDLPDFLDILAVTVRSGLPFRNAL